MIRIVRRKTHQHADVAHPAAFLRLHAERPCGCRATQQRHEFASSQLIGLHLIRLFLTSNSAFSSSVRRHVIGEP